MLPEASAQRRVVEVIADLGEAHTPRWRYGSGLLIGGRRLLTSAHVVIDAVAVSVRRPDKSSMQADLETALIGAPDARGLDIALLDVPEADELPPVPVALVDRDVATGVFIEDCAAVGYPAFMEVQHAAGGPSIRETVQVRGHIAPLSGLVEHLLSLEVTSTPRELPPANLSLGESSWSGMSGAAVFAPGPWGSPDEVLLGVVTEHSPRRGQSHITVLPLDRLVTRGVAPPNADEWLARLGVANARDLPMLPAGASRSRAHAVRTTVRASIPVLRAGEYVERREVTDELIARLLERRSGVMLVIALHGMPGAGKTTLAQAVVQDVKVAGRFVDGILWATLGATPDISKTLTDWIDALSGGGSAPADLQQQSARLAGLLSDKEVLLVLDSVTDLRQAEYLLQVAGSKCITLLTTRDRRIAEDCGASPGDILRLHSMTPEQALAVLGIPSVDDETEADTALKLAGLVGYLPLALRVVRGQHSNGASWKELLEDLGAQQDRLFEVEELPLDDFERKARLNLIASIFLSLRKFSARQQSRFAWLGVFRDDCGIISRMAATLWEMEEREAVGFLRQLDRMALLERHTEASGTTYYQLHATLRAFARAQLFGSARLVDAGIGLQLENIPESQAHIDFVNRYRKHAPGEELTALEDDGYIHDNLIWHLQRAQAIAELRRLLSKEGPDGGNAWFSVRQANARLDRYIGDLKSAWRYEIETGQNVAEVVRYSLILATAWETVPGVSLTLARELIRQNVWNWVAVQSYLSVLAEDESTASSRAAMLLAAAESRFITIDFPFLAKCLEAMAASNNDQLRVETAALLVRAGCGADALKILTGICGIHFVRFLDLTYDLWDAPSKDMVIEQALDKFEKEPDDHLYKAIAGFPQRAGSAAQWTRLLSLIDKHPNPFVRGWSQLLLMRLLLARGDTRSAVRLSWTLDDVTARIRALALLLPGRNSPRKTSRVAAILDLTSKIDDSEYRKKVYHSFYNRRKNVSPAYWYENYPRIAADWLEDLTISLIPYLTHEQSHVLQDIILRASDSDLMARAICALNAPPSDSCHLSTVRRIVQYVREKVSNEDKEYRDTLFYLLPVMTDQERSEVLPQMLDRFSSSQQLPGKAISLFAEYFDDDAHRAALERCDRDIGRGHRDVLFRTLEVGLNHLGNPLSHLGPADLSASSNLKQTLDVLAPHLSRSNLVHAMELLARQYHADDGVALFAANAYVTNDQLDEIAQLAEQMCIAPLHTADDDDLHRLAPALELVFERIPPALRERIATRALSITANQHVDVYSLSAILRAVDEPARTDYFLRSIIPWISESEPRCILAIRIVQQCAPAISNRVANALAERLECLEPASGERRQRIHEMLAAVGKGQFDVQVATRISSLITDYKPDPDATTNFSAEVISSAYKGEREPQTEIEERMVGMGNLGLLLDQPKITPLKGVTISVSGSEALKSQELELQRLADSASYVERAKGLLALAPTLAPQLVCEASKVAEATGILGCRLRAEFELACLRAHGTHTRVASLLPVLLRWIEAPGTHATSSDGTGFRLALSELTNYEDCKVIWNSIAERLPFVGRTCLLSKLPSLSPLITRLEPQARPGIVAAIRDVHRWWP